MPTIDSVRALARTRKQHRGNIADYYKDEGTHRIGAGLYLRVRRSRKKGGSLLKHWAHRYTWMNKPRTDLLGSAYQVTVIDAALAVDAAKDALARGHDPRGSVKLTAAALPTFRDVCEAYMAVKFREIADQDGKIDEAKLLALSSRSNARTWVRELRSYYRVLGDLAPDQIEAQHVSAGVKEHRQRAPDRDAPDRSVHLGDRVEAPAA